jgi:uncharacterized protein involved in response to NO
MTAIPRYRSRSGPVMLSAGFRPFFLLSAIWAALGIPLWLAVFAGEAQIMTALPLTIWHVHEMVFGFGAATVAGFLLTAIPNWTGRLPLQGGPLGLLVLLWAAGRLAILLSGKIGVTTAAALDLSFPVVFLAVVARELIAGRNWRNLPILLALFLLLLGNVLVHLDMVGASATAELGNRLGVATLLMLISLVGGRIIPSFTRNWLTKYRPEIPAPAPFDLRDRAALAAAVLGLGAWILVPEEPHPGSSSSPALVLPCALCAGAAPRHCGNRFSGFFISVMAGWRSDCCCLRREASCQRCRKPRRSMRLRSARSGP